MRLVLPILAATLLMGCGDKDEDTAEETGVNPRTQVQQGVEPRTDRPTAPRMPHLA